MSKVIKTLAVVLVIEGCTAVPYVVGAGSAVRDEMRFRELEQRLTQIEYPVDEDIWDGW